jgi:hypothetical protein
MITVLCRHRSDASTGSERRTKPRGDWASTEAIHMMSVDQLRAAFGVYLTEMERCEKAGAYWALLHLALVLPDICAALEYGPDAKVGERYTMWCRDHFPKHPSLTPDDRYQIRNAVLHEGSTLTNKSQYRSISFVEPRVADLEVHQNVTTSVDGKNLTLDVKQLADETRGAMGHWFVSLQESDERNALVASRLNRVARLQTKETHVPIVTADGDGILSADGDVVGFTMKYPTTSSTGALKIRE